MAIDFSYRRITACLLAVVLLQVIALQSLHQYLGHDHGTTCSNTDFHFHAEGHGHHFCDICITLFAPTVLDESTLSINQPDTVLSESEFVVDECLIIQKYRQSYVRGPPYHTA